MRSSRSDNKQKYVQARSKSTRENLLRAMLECITKYGYRGATMDKIVEHAGVSRGAQGYHFPTKTDLAVSAYEFMLNACVDELRQRADRIRAEDDSPDQLFKFIWSQYYSGHLYTVTVELVVQARSNKHLRDRLAAITEEFHRKIDDCWYILFRGTNADEKKLVLVLNLTMTVIRGLAFQTVLWDRPSYFDELLEEWLAISSQYLDG